MDSHDERRVLGWMKDSGVNGVVQVNVLDADMADAPFMTSARETRYRSENFRPTHPSILTSLPGLLSEKEGGIDGERHKF